MSDCEDDHNEINSEHYNDEDDKIELCEYEGNMFDAGDNTDDEPIPEENPLNLVDQSINVDTFNGKLELYDKENNYDSHVSQTPQFDCNNSFFVSKRCIEKCQLIDLPKNNERVNISDMLSRSFAFDSMTDRYGEKNFNFAGNSSVNQSFNFSNGSPEKMLKNYSTQNLFTLRQNEVIEQMSKEHLKIQESKNKARRQLL